MNTPLMLAKSRDLTGDDAIDQALLLVGIDVRAYAKWLRDREHSKSSNDIDTLITARLAARKAKNFAEADRIRKELEAMGIMLMDTKNKDTGEIETTWEVKR